MSNLTPEQKLAVDKTGTNIIVSAGAGSGKTTVLKERVLRILKSNHTIDELIILTFTNNAAAEMKERIRNIILENKDVESNLELIDSAFITTFDSYAQTLVKKYNYLLNIDKDFSIIDESLISSEIKRIINDIFEEYYVSNPNFKKLVSEIEIKNDKRLKNAIENLYKSLNNSLDKREYLNNYINIFYSEEKINEMFSIFEEHIFSLINDISNIYEEFQGTMLDEKTITENDQAIYPLLNATTYDEVLDSLNFTFVRKGKNNYSDDYKIYKDKIGKIKDEISKLSKLGTKSEIIHNYLSTKDNMKVIIDILLRIDNELTKFKIEHNAYEFHDIALYAIKLVKDYPEVREKIKNSTYEIMIDEYQDTNDIQETFISYIANNNVYTVGDIKQSIYRFRNANPYIFKSRYDAYKNSDEGFKIDLNKNFRSRREVIDCINEIFSYCMIDKIGGADYKNEHKMEFGNVSYDEFNLSNYNLEILNYNNEDKLYNDDEIEAFIIANDIENRIINKEVVTYMDGKVRKSKYISYSDFAILVDKGKNFELLKKVLESKNIPAVIDKDISVKEEDEIYILKNLINLIIHIKNKKIDNDFKHAWISIARSYIARMSDDEIFDVFKNDSFLETDIVKKINDVITKVEAIGMESLIESLIQEFDITNKIILDGNIEEKLAKLELFISKSKSLNEFGYDLYRVNEYFDELLTGESDIKMSTSVDKSNSVLIMTIHGSKGLEYPYVYLPYLNSKMHTGNESELFNYSNNFGIVIPFSNEEYYDYPFTKKIDSIVEIRETLSEKIRLFYVALTRAQEKVILVNKYDAKVEPTDLNYMELLRIRKISEIINKLQYKLSKYIRPIDLSTLKINKKYNNFKYIDIDKLDKSNEIIKVKNINVEATPLEKKHFSKALTKVINKEFQGRLDFGTYMHYVFEVFDFKYESIDKLNISDDAKQKLNNFLKHDEVKNISNAKFYKEKEIMFDQDGKTFHGFIDLLLEYDDHFDIIDYKLSNIESDEYKVQLSGYKDYIESTYNKPTNIYLYSINKDIFKKL